MNLAQFGTPGDLLSQIIWFVLFFVFILLYPRLMTTQSILKLERDVAELEGMADDAREYIVKSIPKKSKTQLRNNIKSFMEFFAIEPVSMDPYGVVKKLDYIIRSSDKRFNMFTKQIAPDLPEVKRKNLRDALAGAMTTHQIAKIVRHNLELVKKYKMFQLAMIIQMQIPLIARIAKAAQQATHAFVDGAPIGDGVGALVVANLMKGGVKEMEDEEFAYARANVAGRNIIVAKASGPGASTGYPGKFLQKVFKNERIDRIITVDAALRLEGEKSGIIAEGVGVAIGGPGVDRYEIEEIAVKKNIPLDAIAIKVSDEEALTPMIKDVVDSIPNAIETIKTTIARTGRNEKILLIGVGNTCGIGNNQHEAQDAERRIRERFKKIKVEKKKFLHF